MAGLDVAGSAVGIASLGIQICQGLLSYYDGWKDYKTDISSTYECITDLCRTLTLIRESAGVVGLDQARATRVQKCLESCVDGLEKLLKRLQKLQTHPIPTSFRQKAWGELQRSFYPFRQSTLIKLKEVVDDLRHSLSLALQELQLNQSITSGSTLNRINIIAHDIASNVQTVLSIEQAAQFQGAIDWLLPPNPWSNHLSARKLHERYTGDWLLQSDRYQEWRSGHTRHLWLYGKAGCGKTVLNSTVIEDLKQYCKCAANACLAVFYFTFSDDSKQSSASLLRSLIAQVVSIEHGGPMLQREYNKRSSLDSEALENIFASSIDQFDPAFIALDALDECPETDATRQSMLDCLERLSQKSPNLKIFATSRELSDIKECMGFLGADVVRTSTRPVDADIQRYVGNELSRDRKLSKLDEALKRQIMETFAQKADGMFRWAYCQLQELKNLQSTRRSHVQTKLKELPPTLDKTYERILNRIDQTSRHDARMFLCWLVYARSPLRLCELVECPIISLSDNGSVHFEDRGGIEDVLNILPGLITVEWNGGCDNLTVNSETVVRLAHFSVQEYLESGRITSTDAKDFLLDKVMGNELLAQSCLAYIFAYSSSDQKTSTKDDLVAFPLLQYAARWWFYHAALQQSANVSREVRLLASDASKNDWLLVYQPDQERRNSFEHLEKIGSCVYYASLLGLHRVLDALFEAGFDHHAQGGVYGNALQAAAFKGDEKIAGILIARGADVNTTGGAYENALQAASARGHEKVVEMLLAKGADVNIEGGPYDNALQAASTRGHEKVVRLLVDAGAHVGARSQMYGNCLHEASSRGYEKVVQMLLDRGADVNAWGGRSGNALRAASRRGNEQVVSILLREGADVNANIDPFGTALDVASFFGHSKVVEMLLEQGADVNAESGFYGGALQAASFKGQGKVVAMLLKKGADVNAQGGSYGNALQAASYSGKTQVVAMLLEAGADVNAQGGMYDTAREAASKQGHETVVELLEQFGASATES